MSMPEQSPFPVDPAEVEPPIDYEIKRTTPFKEYKKPTIGKISSEDPAFKLDDTDAEELPVAGPADKSEKATEERSKLQKILGGLGLRRLVRGKRKTTATPEDEPLAIESGPQPETKNEAEDVFDAVETDLTPGELEEILPSKSAPIPNPHVGMAVVEFSTMALNTVGPTAVSYQHATPPLGPQDHPTQLDILHDDQGPGGQYWTSPDQYVPNPTPEIKPNQAEVKTNLMAAAGKVIAEMTEKEADPELVDKFYKHLRLARKGENTPKPELAEGEVDLVKALSEMTQPIPRVNRAQPILRSAEENPYRTRAHVDVEWLRPGQNPYPR